MSIWDKILDYLKSGGPLMLPIAIFTFAIWFCYIEGLLHFRTLKTNARTRRQTEASLAQMQWIFTCLSTLVVATPLLGLLGTVLGMSGTFNALSTRSSMGGEVANGIQLALVTTQAGLLAAIPGTFALAHLRALRKTVVSRKL